MSAIELKIVEASNKLNEIEQAIIFIRETKIRDIQLTQQQIDFLKQKVIRLRDETIAILQSIS